VRDEGPARALASVEGIEDGPVAAADRVDGFDVGVMIQGVKRQLVHRGVKAVAARDLGEAAMRENRSGVCITISIMNTCPLSRSWLRCRSRSAMACRMSFTVLGRTPPRSLRTRSTVAALTPAWRAISRMG
jgi:hypothetical protein